jgi:hypothetical protein
MKALIDAVENLLDKSEKLKDGSYIVPKWAAQKLIRALQSYRKEEKNIVKKNKKEKIKKRNIDEENNN